MNKLGIKIENKNKKNKILIKFLKIILPIVFLSLWEFLDHLYFFDNFLISSPKKIIKCLHTLSVSKELWNNLFITLFEITISFFLCIALSLFLASLLWYFPMLDAILNSHIVLFNAIPKVAIAPLIIVWLGNSRKTIILISLLISVIPCVLQILSSFKNVSAEKINLVISFGANRISIFSKVIFPANIFSIISASKISLGMSFIGIITGEFLVAKEGIGYLITAGGQLFKPDLIMSGLVLLFLITILFQVLLKFIFNYFNKYVNFATD